MERDGELLDREAASTAHARIRPSGLRCFRHGRPLRQRGIDRGTVSGSRRREAKPSARIGPSRFTKWCPPPGPMTAEVVRAGVERSLRRLGVATIDLLQFHWWSFEHLAYLDAMKELDKLRREGLIRHLGVTNFDTAHLRVAVKHGIEIVSNQVCFSLLDRRAAGEMSAFCLEHGVRLLAYGALAGGFLTQRWLGRPEPAADEINDWSKMKYKRFVDAVGGWPALQAILAALDRVARRKAFRSPTSRRGGRSNSPRSPRPSSARGLANGGIRTTTLRSFPSRSTLDDRALIDEALAKTDSAAWRLRRRISESPVSHRIGRPQPSSRVDAPMLPSRRKLKGVPAGCASPPAAPSSRSPAIAAPCGSAIACWSAEPRRPTGRTKLSAVAIRRRKRRSFSTRSRRALRRWAQASKTSYAPASICATPSNGSRSRARTAAPSARRVPPTRCFRLRSLIGDYEVEIEAEAVVD